MLRSGLPHFFFPFFFWALWAPYREHNKGRCWDTPTHALISFSTMLEVIDFDLDNCYVITYDGRLLKQARGIPDGECALATAGDRNSRMDGT